MRIVSRKILPSLPTPIAKTEIRNFPALQIKGRGGLGCSHFQIAIKQRKPSAASVLRAYQSIRGRDKRGSAAGSDITVTVAGCRSYNRRVRPEEVANSASGCRRPRAPELAAPVKCERSLVDVMSNFSLKVAKSRTFSQVGSCQPRKSLGFPRVKLRQRPATR
jgi:hypothetical protein